MAFWRSIAALFLVGALALAPSLAEARAGGGYSSGGGGSFSSMGSMGSRTYNQPMQRSLTPQSPGYAGQSPGSYGYGNSHPFLTGLAGGLFGGWLGSMLFPHWGMGYGMGMGGVIGPIFLWLGIAWLAWMGFRMFSRGFAPPMGAMAQGGRGMMFGAPGGMSAGAGGASPQAGPLAVAGADYQAFETILKGIQAAWSDGDITRMRQFATPEMLSYFAEELAGNQSQGIVNRVEQVELLRGDLREAWDEGRLQYATCYLRWRALDYNVRSDRRPADPDYVVSGDPRQPVEAGEAWTFARSPGGHWLLSAIQQV